MPTLKGRIKKLVPPSLLNSVLLRVPALYGTRLVMFETNLVPGRGVDNLLAQLDASLAVPGDIIECGSSRGGASVLMARRLKERGEQRRILACDSFEGFDLDELSQERDAGLAVSGDDAFTSTSFDYVTKKFKALGVDDIVTPVKGYFENTLGDLAAGPYCLVFIDCDLEHSLRYCAETLWDGLSSGGRMVFDDYTSTEYRGARTGIDAFVAAKEADISDHGLLSRLYYVQKA